MHRESLALGTLGYLAHERSSSLLVGSSAPVEGGDRLLVLAAHARSLHLGGVGAVGELTYSLRPSGQVGIQLGPGGAGAQQFAAVVSNVGDAPDRDDLPCGGGSPYR